MIAKARDIDMMYTHKPQKDDVKEKESMALPYWVAGSNGVMVDMSDKIANNNNTKQKGDLFVQMIDDGLV
jgi:hypothetical protein